MLKPFSTSLFNYAELENINKKKTASKLLPYYELYKLVQHLEGSIVKCGISYDEAFSYFSVFKYHNNLHQPLIAFEKTNSVFEENKQYETINVKNRDILSLQQAKLKHKSFYENVNFVPGYLSHSIPHYLIKNPELKIILLTIDLDDYESTLTVLEYLYPRIVQGGILILNNYHKKGVENLAVKEYFAHQNIIIRHFNLKTGPHYIMK